MTISIRVDIFTTIGRVSEEKCERRTIKSQNLCGASERLLWMWFIIVKAKKNVFTLQNDAECRCAIEKPTRWGEIAATTIPLKFNCLKNHQKKPKFLPFVRDTRSTSVWFRRQIIESDTREEIWNWNEQHSFLCWQQMWLLWRRWRGHTFWRVLLSKNYSTNFLLLLTSERVASATHFHIP